jgi:hypothetical protein
VGAGDEADHDGAEREVAGETGGEGDRAEGDGHELGAAGRAAKDDVQEHADGAAEAEGDEEPTGARQDPGPGGRLRAEERGEEEQPDDADDLVEA